MERFISSFIRILVKLIIFLFILIFGLLVYMFAISYQNNVSVEDTVLYVKSSVQDGITALQDIANINSSSTVGNITGISDIQNDIDTTSNTSNSNYYYSQLDSNGKFIYMSLNNNINNLKKENFVINFDTKFNELLNTTTGQYELNKSFQSALDAFFYDHPELFYIDLTKITLSIKYISFATKTTYRVSITPQNGYTNYLYDAFSTEADVNIAISNVENIKNSIISKLSGLDTYSKILKVHDSLVNLVQYDSSLTGRDIYSIYGALYNKSAVCEGYSRAFKYILDQLNIECILVSGNATNSSNETESHMWNYVKLNDIWYAVDVTWDDPIIIGKSSFANNIIRHDYFLKGSSSFNSSHKASGKITDSGMLFTLPTLSYINYKK